MARQDPRRDRHLKMLFWNYRATYTAWCVAALKAPRRVVAKSRGVTGKLQRSMTTNRVPRDRRSGKKRKSRNIKNGSATTPYIRPSPSRHIAVNPPPYRRDVLTTNASAYRLCSYTDSRHATGDCVLALQVESARATMSHSMNLARNVTVQAGTRSHRPRRRRAAIVEVLATCQTRFSARPFLMSPWTQAAQTYRAPHF